MEFKVNCGMLQGVLRKLKPVIKDTYAVESLRYYKVNIDPAAGLEITSSDMDMFLTEKISNTEVSADETFGFLIVAKLFTELIMLLNASEDLRFELASKNKKLIIKCGAKTYTLSYLDESEYVEIPNFDLAEQIEVEGKRLKEGLDYVDYAVDDDDMRPAFTGIKFDRNDANNLVLVATDGKKLSRFVTDLNANNMSLIIPQKASDVLKTILPNGSIKIGVINNMLVFKTDNVTFYARLIKGNYPEYKGIIPTNSTINFVAKTKDLLKNVKDLLKLTDKSKRRLIFELTGEGLQITAFTADEDEQIVKQELVSYSGEIRISIQGVYLVDTLSVISQEEVKFEMTDPTKVIKITAVGNESGLNLVMPVRLDK